MRFHAPFATALALLVALLTASCSTMSYTHGVPNLLQVDPGVYRGGEPTHEGWVYLQSLGVKTVVKLNSTDEASDADARALGLAVVYVPLPPSRLGNLFAEPQAMAVTRAVATLLEAGRGPFYVHCSHGQDRTGLVIALYRVLHDGWTKDRAHAEMEADGFHDSLRGLVRFWGAFHGTLPGLVRPSVPSVQPAASPDSAPTVRPAAAER